LEAHKADAGLSGRKILWIVMGGSCPHGGGSFSGKDPTKIGSKWGPILAKNFGLKNPCWGPWGCQKSGEPLVTRLGKCLKRGERPSQGPLGKWGGSQVVTGFRLGNLG